MRALAMPLVAALALATPAWAMSDAEAMQKVEKFYVQFRQAFKDSDANTIAKTYLSDGVYVAVSGKRYTGPQQVQEAFAGIFKSFGGFKSVDIKPTEAHALGNSIWVLGTGHIEGNKLTSKTHFAAIYELQGDDLKTRMVTVGADSPPPKQD